MCADKVNTHSLNFTEYLLSARHGAITSRHIEGEEMEVITDFVFLVSKITADSDCNHEIKRRLLLGRKAKIGRAHV